MNRKVLLRLCWIAAGLLTAFAPGGCALIDERMKDCPEEMTVTCYLNLSSNKDQEMDEKLGTEHDRPVRAALESYLEHVFVSSVREVDLYFYDQRKRGKMTHEQHELMDAGEREFEIRLPASDYRVAGAANVSALPDVTLAGAEGNYEVLQLVQRDAERLPTQPEAVFTARQRMTVRDREGQHFDVRFQMANAAAALIINRDSCEVKGIRADYSGLSDSFKILDSAYSFNNTTLIGTDEIHILPYVGSDEDNRYVTLPDNTVTRSEIYIGKPMQAGQLLIIKGWLTGDGGFTGTPEHAPYNPDPGGPDFPPEPPEPPEPPVDSTVVGVTVMLNWTEGLVQHPSL